MLSFKEFVAAYNDGSIADDLTWRAYAIEDMVTETRYKKAMKVCGHMDTTPLGLAEFAAAYDLKSADRAKQLLGLWWTWARIVLGEVKQEFRLKLREQNNEH